MILKPPEIRLDCTNALDEVVSSAHGLSDPEIDEWVPRVEGALQDLEEEPPGFLELPEREDLLGRVREAEAHLEGVREVVLLGIGGSALGPRAIFDAIWGPWGLTRVGKPGGPARALHVADNIDPEGFAQLLDGLDLAHTLFNVVSKSGSTVETMAQLTIAWRLVRERLGPAEVARRFLFTTDPEHGRLREIAARFSVPTLEIPPDIGGRYSVLTAVGLFPALATGVDPADLLAGAREMNRRCRGTPVHRNPAALLAIVHTLLDRLRGKSIAVMMPYSDRLRTFAEWFAQLWAESLGKSETPSGEPKSPSGQTPVRALGTTDQHSQIQLYVQGPNDKLITLLAVEQREADLALGSEDLFEAAPGLSYLAGHRLGEVFEIEQVATEMALARAGRPTLVWRIPSVGAHVLGQLFQVYEIACALAGALLHVNPFDQPGVEEGKNLTYGALGREGYETKGLELESYRARRDSWIVGETNPEGGGER